MFRFLGRAIFVLVLLIAAVLAFAPRERVGVLPLASVPPADRPEEAVSSLLRAEEITPGIMIGAEKEVIWAREDRTRTPLSIIYIHGFSATKEETRPLADDLAAELGANLFYTRLSGHGRTDDALGRAKAAHWMLDMAEALEIGRAIGEEVLVIGTSMGGALAALSAAEPAGRENVAGYVMISPAFQLRAAGTSLLTKPFARWFTPILIGEERHWVGVNPEHEKWWTNRYPTGVLAAVAAVAETAFFTDYSLVKRPALFILAEDDEIVDPAAIREVAERWGGRSDILPLAPGPDDDPQAHVLAGRILSPNLTPVATQAIIDWAIQNGVSQGPGAEDDAE